MWCGLLNHCLPHFMWPDLLHFYNYCKKQQEVNISGKVFHQMSTLFNLNLQIKNDQNKGYDQIDFVPSFAKKIKLM